MTVTKMKRQLRQAPVRERNNGPAQQGRQEYNGNGKPEELSGVLMSAPSGAITTANIGKVLELVMTVLQGDTAFGLKGAHGRTGAR
jgi:hypothetical protein